MKEECPHCLGTGIQHLPDGDSDFSEDYCYCDAGQKREAEDLREDHIKGEEYD